MLLCLFLIAACGQDKSVTDHLKTKTMTRVAQKEEFGEHGFLSGTMGMTYRDDTLFVPDNNGSRVLCLDSKLQVTRVIGKPGEGPGELSMAGMIGFSQGRVFVDSPLNQRLGVFDEQGTFLDWVPTSGLSFRTRFAVYDEMIFASSSALEKPITVIDTSGNRLYQFGEILVGDFFQEKRARNVKHIGITELSQQPVIVALGFTEPTLELFSLNGDLLHREWFNDHPMLRLRLDYVAQQYKNNPESKKASYQLFDDMEIQGDTLIALVSSLQPPYAFICCRLNTDKIMIEDVFLVKERMSIQSFAFDGKQHLYLFDGQTSEIQKYRLGI